jgi:hypothetical protein
LGGRNRDSGDAMVVGARCHREQRDSAGYRKLERWQARARTVSYHG